MILTKPEYIRLAGARAKHSPADGPRKTGCIIVDARGRILGQGCNCPPHGIKLTAEECQRPLAYEYLEHAERDALANMARRGISARGCILFSTLFPCVDCARATVNHGIAEVVAPEPDFADERWGAQFRVALDILNRGGVVVTYA